MTPVHSSETPAWRAALFLAFLLLGLAYPRSGAGVSAQEAGELFLPVISRPGVFSQEPLGRFNFVTAIAGMPGDRLLVGERGGRVWSLNTAGQTSLFLDISGRVVTEGLEQGLLGVAVDPAFAQNGYVYVSYTRRSGSAYHVQVSRFHVPAGSASASSSSEVVLFRVAQQSKVHHGGGLAFGPRDGWLYVSLGEGFEHELAQRDDSTRGKIIRLATGELLAGNPPPLQRWLDAEARVRGEVWASGLRNPWRIAFDPRTGDLLLADVGFQQWEEVDVIPDGRAGLNFGWPCREGPATLSNAGDCATGVFEPPIHAYRRTGARCAIIGGAVTNDGRYIAGDYCSREIFLLQRAGDEWQPLPLGLVPNAFLTTFGQDTAGRVYAGTMGESEPIYRLTLP